MVKIYKQVEVVTTQIFVVGIESEVLTEEGLKEFSDTISYVDEVDDLFLEAACQYARGCERFIEGIGKVGEVVDIEETDFEIQSEIIS